MRRLLAAVAVVTAIAGCASTPQHHHAATRTLTPGPLPVCPGHQTVYGCQAHSATFGLPPARSLTGRAPSLARTVEMFDSVTVSTVPAGAQAVAGYLSGFWPTFRPLVAAFPRAHHVPVAIAALPVYKSLVGRMVCLDVEPGDAPPSEAGPWVRGERVLGVKPCVYASLSEMPAVRASIAKFGVKRSRVFLWDADWTFHAGLDAGYDATQWTDHAFGRNLDESTVSRAFLGVNPAPKPPVCITHRMTRFECNGRKEQIAKDHRAAASSQRAYARKGCPVLSQRVSWFGTQLRKHPKTRVVARRRALAASRKAYRQRACPVFAQRARFFTSSAARLTAAS